MKRKKWLILNLAVLVGLIVIWWLAQLVLGLFNLVLRNTVSYPLIGLTVILSLTLVVQIIQFLFRAAAEKKRKPPVRILSGIGMAALSALLALSLVYGPFLFAFSHQREHVVEKDGKKMVAYVESFLQITVRYYDYKNPFVRGKQIKIMVDGGNGGADPFENGGTPYVHRYEYYDDNGKTIASNWAG